MKKNGYTDDGIYTIFIGKRLTESLAYCKQQLHGGGWQVIQQRLYQGKYSQKIEHCGRSKTSESVFKSLVDQGVPVLEYLKRTLYETSDERICSRIWSSRRRLLDRS